MKITESKIKANRENAKRGGVKTTQGKEVSKMNALKHGILANTICEFDDLEILPLFQTLCEEFGVQTIYQKMLVEELCSTYVKIARCAKYQKQKLNESLHTVDCFSEMSLSRIDEGYKSQMGDNIMNKLEVIFTRYEPQLVNRMIKLVLELKMLQGNN